jgi:hypothetical protein
MDNIGVFFKTYCKYKWFYLLKTNVALFFSAKEWISLRLWAFASPILRKGAKINDYDKKAKSFHLAPIAVKILVARGSGDKIATNSETNAT